MRAVFYHFGTSTCCLIMPTSGHHCFAQSRQPCHLILHLLHFSDYSMSHGSAHTWRPFSMVCYNDLIYIGCLKSVHVLGVYLSITFVNLRGLYIKQRSRLLFAYTSLIFAITTVYYGCAINSEQRELIDSPGDTVLGLSVDLDIIVNVMFVACFWFSDLLVVCQSSM